MKVLIVEDELLLARQLKSLLQKIDPAMVIEGPCNSIDSTVKWLTENGMPDLLLLDIELADGQCFDIFERMEVTAPVIFTTAYDEYTLKAFKVNSIDYLLKPIKEEELSAAIRKWKQFHQTKNPASFEIKALLSEIRRSAQGEFRNRFLVKQGQKLVPIPVEETAYYFTRAGVSNVMTHQRQRFILDYTLDEIEQSLDPRQFYRANRQYIVSLKSVKTVHSWFNGKLKLELDQPVEEDIIVSREKATDFKEWLGA